MKDEIKEILDKLEKDYLTENQLNKLKDYITNLQEENKKLEEDNYELQKYINEEEGFVKDENRELGLRIDKAVEYIKNEPYNLYDEDDDKESCGKFFENEQYDNLLNILEGDKD